MNVMWCCEFYLVLDQLMLFFKKRPSSSEAEKQFLQQLIRNDKIFNRSPSGLSIILRCCFHAEQCCLRNAELFDCSAANANIEAEPHSLSATCRQPDPASKAMRSAQGRDKGPEGRTLGTKEAYGNERLPITLELNENERFALPIVFESYLLPLVHSVILAYLVPEIILAQHIP